MVGDGGEEIVRRAQVTEVRIRRDITQRVVGIGRARFLVLAAAFEETLLRFDQLRESRGRHSLFRVAGQLGAGVDVLQRVGIVRLREDVAGRIRHLLGQQQAFGVVAGVVEGLDDAAIDRGLVGHRKRRNGEENGKQKTEKKKSRHPSQSRATVSLMPKETGHDDENSFLLIVVVMSRNPATGQPQLLLTPTPLSNCRIMMYLGLIIRSVSPPPPLLHLFPSC